jgi:hypothetical protein
MLDIRHRPVMLELTSSSASVADWPENVEVSEPPRPMVRPSRMPLIDSDSWTSADYLRRLGASGDSAIHDTTAEVHQAFRDETGMTFARWRYAARMRTARDLLVGGAKPSAVARRVGYAHMPTFSAAFTRFHGLSPREYQDREIRQA